MHYGTKKEDLAAVSVANYNYAATNPVAQMQKTLTLEEAMSAPVVVPPLTLYDCCPITDGAAGLFTWQYDAADVATAGSYEAQFTATYDTGPTPARTRRERFDILPSI